MTAMEFALASKEKERVDGQIHSSLLCCSAETIKRKLNILKEHCKSVGRDYDSILKTELDLVVIDDSEEMARKRAFEITFHLLLVIYQSCISILNNENLRGII